MKINYQFKLLYALGMIFIVAGHSGGGGINLFYDWLPPYSFHLGLFVFASGYFYNSKSQDSVGKYLVKKVKTLILPLYIWNFVYALISEVLLKYGFTFVNKVTLSSLFLLPITNGHQFAFNLGGWFVIPLFAVQVYNVLTRKLLNLCRLPINEWIYCLFNFILGASGVYLASRGFNTGWWLVLTRTLFFIPFYSVGYLYKIKLEKKDTLSTPIYLGIILACLLIIRFAFGRIPTYTPSWCNDFVDGPFMPFIIGFLGIGFWLRICRIGAQRFGKNKYVNLIADSTYSIMINQLFGIFLVNTALAVISKTTGFCNSFDIYQYKHSIWYLFLPKNAEQFKIVYLIAGIAFPVCIQLIINSVFKGIRRLKNKNQ